MPQPLLPSLTELSFRNGDIDLRAVAAGPEQGPVVLLLHGFPEFWYGWRHQLASLAEAGFRVIALDQRGYNLSSKPQRHDAYSLDALASDVIAVIDQVGRERVFVAGHDWGGAVAWYLGLRHPQRIERLAILNCPHPSAMLHALKTNPRQMLRSYYMFILQIPGLPEALMRAQNFKALADSLGKSSRPGTFTAADFERYRAAWNQPGALTAMVNWYRGVPRRLPPFTDKTVRVPALIIWGLRDQFAIPELAQASARYCEHGELITIAEATHWVQHEEPHRVNELLCQHFSAARAMSP